MNREVLDGWCERGILALVLGVLVFAPLATGAVRTQDFLVIEGMTVAAMLLWAIRLWIGRKPKLLFPPVCWAVMAFSLYAVARYLTADIEYVARHEMIRVLVYAFLFFLVLNNLHRQETTQIIVFTLVFLAMLVAGYAVFQYFTRSNKVWNFVSPYGHRGSGTFISPNNCAGFLEMILPLGFAWAFVSRAKPTLKIFIGYAALVMMAGVAVTISRGGWIAAAISLLALFSLLLLNHNYRLPALVVLAALIAGGFFFVSRSQTFALRFAAISKDEKINSDARFDLWLPAVQMWRTNPWWGVGPAHYDCRFRAWRPVTEQRQPDRAHNDYLNTLADWGVAGFALVLSAWLLLGLGAVKTWRYVAGSQSDFGGRSSNKFALVLGASTGLLAILVHSVVDFNMHVPANAILAVTLMALLSGCLRFATDNCWFSARVPLKILATICLLAGAAYLTREGIRAETEFYWLEKARLAGENPDGRKTALQNAFAVEPMNAATAYEIGETIREQNWEASDDFTAPAAEAIQWYAQSAKLNPYDGYNFLRSGMCLDWIGQHEKAREYYDRAVELDPNGYFTVANVGWHYVQIQDYAAAKTWLERSLRLDWKENTIAQTYLTICDQKLREAAEGGKATLPGLPPR